MKKILIGLTILGIAAFVPIAQAHDYDRDWRGYDGWHGNHGWHRDHGWHQHAYFHHHSHVFIGYYPSYYSPYCY